MPERTDFTTLLYNISYTRVFYNILQHNFQFRNDLTSLEISICGIHRSKIIVKVARLELVSREERDNVFELINKSRRRVTLTRGIESTKQWLLRVPYISLIFTVSSKSK